MASNNALVIFFFLVHGNRKKANISKVPQFMIDVRFQLNHLVNHFILSAIVCCFQTLNN